jgi:hypothetical protein
VLDGCMSPKKKAVAASVAAAACVTGGEEGVAAACGAAPMATCSKKERALLADVNEYPGLR